MATKYCSQHGITYDYAEGCPECNKIPNLVGKITGNIIGGAIYGTVWAGMKIHEKLKQGKIEKIEDKSIKFCTRCGAKKVNVANFCPQCGTKFLDQ